MRRDLKQEELKKVETFWKRLAVKVHKISGTCYITRALKKGLQLHWNQKQLDAWDDYPSFRHLFEGFEDRFLMVLYGHIDTIKEFEGKNNYLDEFIKKLRQNEYPVYASVNYYVKFANPVEDLQEEAYKTHEFMDSRAEFVISCCTKNKWEFASPRKAVYAAVAIINLILRPYQENKG